MPDNRLNCRGLGKESGVFVLFTIKLEGLGNPKQSQTLPRPLEVGQHPLAERGGCHNAEKWTPSSVLLFRQDFTGMTFRKANAARQADSAYGIAMA
ncbi:MAG: hypothetical protein CL923_02680 [Deltaproteobacteria bacterium]|nr:hypothetical protein [Deltaproteobacteria bacterium]